MRNRIHAAAIGLLLISLFGIDVRSQEPDAYRRLIEISGEIRGLDLEEVSDLSGTAFEVRAGRLGELKQKLLEIDPRDWTIPRRADYLLVHSQLAQHYFEHAALRPWRRDPGFYVDRVSRIPFVELPLDQPAHEKLEAQLEAVPTILMRGRENLNEAAVPLAELALRNLEKADGVGHGHPRRSVPPPGVIGWYDDLQVRVQLHHPELAEKVEASLAALKGFRDWLTQQLPQMAESAGVGEQHYNWNLSHVRLMPFDAHTAVQIGERELHRALTFLALEKWRNRDLPPLAPASSEAEYERRIEEAGAHVREFLTAQKILTLPADLGQFDHNVPWVEREGGKLNFWEAVQFRDPLPDYVHAVLPGHRFDSLLHRRDQHPIRGMSFDSGRVEGWGFYLEEMLLQSGLLENRPRTRELFYLFQAARAVRNRAEVSLHTNRWTIDEAVRYMVESVPFMDEDVARVDCEIYLRRPGYGISYLMGRVQIEQLLADRRRQLGDRFDLAAFHDQFLASGWIPISLIRWEMTGLDDQVGGFWRSIRFPER